MTVGLGSVATGQFETSLLSMQLLILPISPFPRPCPRRQSSLLLPCPSFCCQAGKIDGPQNKVLMNRFGISSFPAIFLLKDGSAWEYEGARTVQAVGCLAGGGGWVVRQEGCNSLTKGMFAAGREDAVAYQGVGSWYWAQIVQ